MRFLKKSFCFSVLYTSISLLFFQLPADEPFFSKLTVQGAATIYKPSEQFTMNIGIVTQDAKAEIALKENTIKMQQVFAELKKIGLEEKEFQTGQFNVSPVYSQPPKNPSSDWRQEIVGYQVTNSIAIRTDKLDMASKAIDAASSAGANLISNISFSLRDSQKHRSEVISIAAANAFSDAKALAEALNVKLVKIVDISLEEPRSLRGSFEKKLMAFSPDAATSTPIEAGDVEMTATVSIVYEIAPNGD